MDQKKKSSPGEDAICSEIRQTGKVILKTKSRPSRWALACRLYELALLIEKTPSQLTHLLRARYQGGLGREPVDILRFVFELALPRNSALVEKAIKNLGPAFAAKRPVRDVLNLLYQLKTTEQEDGPALVNTRTPDPSSVVEAPFRDGRFQIDSRKLRQLAPPCDALLKARVSFDGGEFIVEVVEAIRVGSQSFANSASLPPASVRQKRRTHLRIHRG